MLSRLQAEILDGSGVVTWAGCEIGRNAEYSQVAARPAAGIVATMTGPNTDRRLALFAFNASRFADSCSTPRASAFCSRARPARTFVIVVSTVMGIAALAGAVQNRLLRQANRAERLTRIAAGLPLVHPGVVTDGAGLVLIFAVVLMQKLRSI